MLKISPRGLKKRFKGILAMNNDNLLQHTIVIIEDFDKWLDEESKKKNMSKSDYETLFFFDKKGRNKKTRLVRAVPAGRFVYMLLLFYSTN